MNILVTGARGFVGKNLVASLKNIKDGKDKTFPIISELNIFEYNADTDPALLDEYCGAADFVFNLAGVNRPKDQGEFMSGNFGFASTLLDTLKKHGNRCPVMLSSSTQAGLDNPYGKSKKPEKTCCSSTRRIPEHRCWFTASRISSANGAARTTTARLQPSAIISPRTCPSRSTTAAS